MLKPVDIKDLKSVKERFTLKGKKVIVTGATSGYGMATSAAIAELGGDVAMVGLPTPKAEENAEYLAKKFGVDVFTIYADVSKKDDVQRMMDTVLKRFGRLDAVHSNAGIISADDNGDMPLESWQRMIDVNLTGTFLVNQAAAVYMRDNGIKGCVVNTASMSGHVVNQMQGRQMVCYTTTKAGIIHLTKSFAMDFADAGIRFNSVSPGTFASGIHDNTVPEDCLRWMESLYPMGRFGTLDEVVGIVVFLMTDLASFITGADFLVDGGYTAR